MQNVTRRTKYIRNINQVLEIPEAERRALERVTDKFAFRVNDYYLSLIDWSDPHDPIRQLIIPREEELNDWGKLDACNESSITVARGVQHKYKSTVLLLCNEVCSAYCRYCFRKRLFMRYNAEVNVDIMEGIQYIRENPSITNVLLTGGDPLLLSTSRIASILYALREIPHVQIIRIGTKTCAFNPWRFLDDDDLIDLFERISRSDKRLYLMMHFDHPRELTQPAVEAINRCIRAGAILCNQCPMIKGVNDNAETLSELFNLLSFIGCPPYYMFQGRPTMGNMPYNVPITRGFQIFQEAGRSTSGLAGRARFVMSHETGKIEIVGLDDHSIFFRYHRAKNPKDVGRLMIYKRDDTALWLDDLKPVAV